MNDGAFVGPDAQTAELIQPNERPLDTRRQRPRPLPFLVRRIANSGRM